MKRIVGTSTIICLASLLCLALSKPADAQGNAGYPALDNEKPTGDGQPLVEDCQDLVGNFEEVQDHVIDRLDHGKEISTKLKELFIKIQQRVHDCYVAAGRVPITNPRWINGFK